MGGKGEQLVLKQIHQNLSARQCVDFGTLPDQKNIKTAGGASCWPAFLWFRHRILKQDRRLAAWITETGIEKLEFNTDYLALLGLDPKVAPGNIYFFHMCVFYPLPGRKFFDGPLEPKNKNRAKSRFVFHDSLKYHNKFHHLCLWITFFIQQGN